ncbi:MAG: Tim44 domain-containing protein [Hyphomicrobiaceae bacterium]|nr:Tim44 domain-containing protein [Hyphomicrobiaceae bacterium]
MGGIDVVTLIIVVLAVAIFIKLVSVLGRRTGHEQTRIERYRAQQEARQHNGELVGQDKVVTLPRRERDEEEEPPAASQPAQADGEQRMRDFAGGDNEVGQALVDIFRADPAFDPDHFLQGAKAAYEIIVTAFAEGNRRTLKTLLNAEVYDGFTGAIADRERRGEQIDQSFVGIKSADLVEADLKGGVAQLTVKFVSELISATRDRAGVVINGDPKRIREVTDIWTFAREVPSRDPNWKLIATQAAN